MTEENQISQEILPEIFLAQILREKRQDLKMEIAEVSSYLRVKPNDILAIENNDFGRITRHLYVPGLIRSYAKLLKINQQIIEEKIKQLPIKSNTDNKKHQLLNVGENIDLTPNKDSFFNFLLISILLFLVLLSIYSSVENTENLITNEQLITEMEKTSS